MCVICAATVLAQTGPAIGTQEAKLVTSIYHSQYGVFIGMALGLYGLYLWLMSRAMWGAILIALSVAFTQAPELYSGLRTTFAPIADKLGGGTAVNLTF